MIGGGGEGGWIIFKKCMKSYQYLLCSVTIHLKFVMICRNVELSMNLSISLFDIKCILTLGQIDWEELV